jgi:hypothetical protein
MEAKIIKQLLVVGYVNESYLLVLNSKLLNEHAIYHVISDYLFSRLKPIENICKNLSNG